MNFRERGARQRRGYLDVRAMVAPAAWGLNLVEERHFSAQATSGFVQEGAPAPQGLNFVEERRFSAASARPSYPGFSPLKVRERRLPNSRFSKDGSMNLDRSF
jgi:hypothetical protein